MKEAFWMVWCEDGREPTVKHKWPAAAKAETERLAAVNPGRKFYVLQAIGFAVREEVTFHYIEHDEIPF